MAGAAEESSAVAPAGERRSSLFDRWVARPRRPWLAVGVSALLLLAPLAAAALDGTLADLFSQGGWRALLVPPVVVIYIVAVAPRLGWMDDRVVRSLRPVVLVDDADYRRLIDQATAVRPGHELIAVAKHRELVTVQGHVVRACRALVQRLDEGLGTGSLPADIEALSAFEQRLRVAATWPYDTRMLRTVFLSVVVPGATVLARMVVETVYQR